MTDPRTEDLTPGARLGALRAGAPLVHNITNYVAMNVMANVMLAAGASPAMVHAREEAPGFAAIAAGLSVNVGTLSAEWAESMQEAAQSASARGKPWALDPVAVFASDWRGEVCRRLVELRPSLVRGNASEILALAGFEAGAKGADAGDEVQAAEAAARALALRTGRIVAVTGPVDYVTDGSRALTVANGHALMPKVTALGCSLTGLCAAFLAVEPEGGDALGAVAACLAFYGLAGERAAERASGPGSFAVAFLDALHGISPADLDAGARIAEAGA